MLLRRRTYPIRLCDENLMDQGCVEQAGEPKRTGVRPKRD